MLLVQVPPVVALLNVVVAPAHIGVVPVIDAGKGFTTTEAVTVQLAPEVNVIVALPAETPVTMPVEDPMVATELVPLLHVPPLPSVNVVVDPTHTVVVPPIADGDALIVTSFVSLHPVDRL